MSKPIIEVKNLSKKYVLGERQPYYSLRDTISGIFNTQFHKDKLKRDEFWALKDVSFDINRGDIVGVIGRNGAGKSTLLKILSQITPPTEGEVIMRGRVASLLEVGTGFHPELTGRENIYLNGAILGMKKWEINHKFKEIVDFAEIEKFLDTPVKHYSSGMYMRLAFAVSAHLEPEILLIDEVLAVGDSQFQNKCLGKMSEVSKQGRTVIFVSHNMAAISALCNSGIFLENGKVEYLGKIESTVDKYNLSIASNSNISLSNRKDRTGNKLTKFTKIIFNDGGQIYTGKSLILNLFYESESNEILNNSRVSIDFYDKSGNFLFVCSTEQTCKKELNLASNGSIECVISPLPLAEGEYYISIFFEVNHTIRDWVNNVSKIIVQPGKFFDGIRQCPIGFEGKGVLISHKWICDNA